MVIRNAYDSLNERFEFGQKNWCTYVKEILNQIEVTDIWNKQCLPKTIYNKTFKTDFRLENYLLTLQNRGHKIALTKFRKSSHNLHIETGHYEKTEIRTPSKTLCVLCHAESRK